MRHYSLFVNIWTRFYLGLLGDASAKGDGPTNNDISLSLLAISEPPRPMRTRTRIKSTSVSISVLGDKTQVGKKMGNSDSILLTAVVRVRGPHGSGQHGGPVVTSAT